MAAPARKTQNAKGTAWAGVRAAHADPKTGKLAKAQAAYKDAVAQRAAIAEVLTALARSHTDPGAVFTAIARNAVRLCAGAFCNVLRYDGELLHIAANYGMNAKVLKRLHARYPMRPSVAGQISGRVIAQKKPVCIADVLEDKTYDKAAARAGGWRRIFGVPMLHQGKPVGAIAVAWKEPGEIPPHQITILETFADQAVIALENARLFKETTEALERQTATAEILNVISNSPTNTQPVFEAIVQSGLKLFPGALVAVIL